MMLNVGLPNKKRAEVEIQHHTVSNKHKRQFKKFETTYGADS